ncbi:hypothetical protein J4479_01315 [Candidatus Woesearchaeota archaeon]|nr:hypothetical protein [Candidatus Woesearchaeota archaeon]
MKVTITKNQHNVLLNRSELTGAIELEGGATPSNNDLTLELGRGKDASLVVIKKIKTSYGRAKATFSAVIYDSLKDKNDVEQQTKHQRKQAEEAKKTAEAASA